MGAASNNLTLQHVRKQSCNEIGLQDFCCIPMNYRVRHQLAVDVDASKIFKGNNKLFEPSDDCRSIYFLISCLTVIKPVATYLLFFMN